MKKFKKLEDKITDFLNIYCTRVTSSEDISYIELMMDDHDVIQFEDCSEYYLPRDNMLFSEKDEKLRDWLKETYCITLR